MRPVDHLAEREETRSCLISAMGLSGGGGSVMWLAAMGERIEFAVIAAHLKSYHEESAGCPCNLVPGLQRVADRGEIAGLIPARRLFVQSGKADSGVPLPLVEAAMKPATVITGLLDSPPPVLEIHPGGHRWSDARVWTWLTESQPRKGPSNP